MTRIGPVSPRRAAELAHALQVLREHPRRLVSAVSKSKGPLNDALFDVAFSPRPFWSLAQVQAVLDHLDALSIRIDAWLESGPMLPELGE